MVVGAPAASLRRRLKYASLFFDRILVEDGAVRISAGPTASSCFPVDLDTPWQTPNARRVAQAGGFTIGFGQETVPGVPAEVIDFAFSSETTISWIASYQPLVPELAGRDWITWVNRAHPDGAAKRLAADWSRLDQRNGALRRAVPIDLVRQTIVSAANTDLAATSLAGVAASVDSLHGQVLQQRLADDSGWRPLAFSVPFLFPNVAHLSWDAIADLRKDRNIARFRALLQEVELSALAEASGGDVEAAAHHVYERNLAAQVEPAGGYGGSARRMAGSIIVSGLASMATMALPAPAAIAAAASLGAAPFAVADIWKVRTRRRSRAWLSVVNRIGQR
jgi:hypothetical protein